MSVPAGFEDEYDSDFDDFDFEYPRYKSCQTVVRERTIDEKLIDAVHRNDLEAARQALDGGANVHVKLSSAKNWSPIMEAASWGHYEMIEFLVSQGADVNDNCEMYNVLMCVCDSSCDNEEELLKCLNFLLDKGADPLATDWLGTTSLIVAARQNRQLLAERLINVKNSLIDTPDGEGWTPLFFAVNHRKTEMVRLLLKEGADVNGVDKSGHPLWEIALATNDKDIVTLIVPPDIIESEYSDESVVPLTIHLSAYKEAMLCTPRKNDRLYGFHKEVISFIRGIGLEHLLPIIEKEKVQFAQLLTWGNDDWKAAGISMSYHLKKISLAVRRFHEQNWGRGSVPDSNAVVVDGCVDLFKVVQLLLSCVRIAHITSASSLYLRHSLVRQNSANGVTVGNLLAANAILRKQISSLRDACTKIDKCSPYPPDLIKKRHLEKRSGSVVKLVLCGGVMCAVIFKYRFLKINVLNNLTTCYVFLKQIAC